VKTYGGHSDTAPYILKSRHVFTPRVFTRGKTSSVAPGLDATETTHILASVVTDPLIHKIMPWHGYLARVTGVVTARLVK
jgi:hypothetical protein